MVQDYIENETTTLVTVRQVNSLRLPSIIICPRNADAIHLDELIDNVRSVVPLIDNITVRNVIRFAISGLGFSAFDEATRIWTNSTIESLSAYYETWKNNRSDDEMFKLILEDYGYTCKETFLECFQGGVHLNCCDIFEFTYVALRGRCLRLRELYQTDNEETAKLSITLGSVPSPLSELSYYQQQMVAYVGDRHKDVWVTPRYYLNAYDWTRMRFRIRQKEMLTNKLDCRVPDEDEGSGTCSLVRWLRETVEKPFNCTFVYTKVYNHSLPTCKPRTIIENYRSVLLTPTSNFRCLPTCIHNETSLQIYSSPSIYGTNDKRVFMIEASYPEMQIEEYREIVRTTMPGFVSQIGGQVGLFLGASIITFVQFFVTFSMYMYRRLRLLYRYIQNKWFYRSRSNN
uniref:Sodium channel protein Nach n=1 Tax=Syphacia muris TaxID=451379 RepID=A0A0N5AL20_9BILA